MSVDKNVTLTRIGAPAELPATNVLAAAGRGEEAFALSLFGRLDSDRGNLAIAPSSIATVLGMVTAGARGETRQQLIDALGIDVAPAQLHAAIGGLVRALQRDTPGVTLSEVDQTWIQQHLTLVSAFARTLTTDYASPLASIDFGNTTKAAATINAWVALRTHGKITKLVSAESLGAAALVLTDAVYLDAKWEHGFDPKLTASRPFHLASGSTVTVPTMGQTAHLAAAVGAGWTAVALPYKGGKLEMDVIAPDDLAGFERSLDRARLDAVLGALKPAQVDLQLPKFEFRKHFDNLNAALGQLGVHDAFDPNRADFSGMTTTVPVFLSTLVHETFVHVDEQGTVAAGATGGVMQATGAEVVVPVHVDKPFLFVVRDPATGAIVFLGHVTDPRAS